MQQLQHIETEAFPPPFFSPFFPLERSVNALGARNEATMRDNRSIEEYGI